MKQNLKRLCSYLLVLSMLLSVLPFGVFAASDPDSYVFDIAEGTIQILDGDTAGTIKVRYGDGLYTPDFDPSQEITVTGTFVATDTPGKSLKVETNLPVTVRIRDLTIDNDLADYYEAMALFGNAANVTLILEGTNYLRGGKECGGIDVNEGRTLTIKGDGALTAQGYAGAGIGGHNLNSCGTVNIESGTVKAIGRADAAGIGGGGKFGSTNTTGNGGIVTIKGGTVTAISYGAAAAIGGGSETADTGTLTVNGDAWVTAANIGGTKTLTAGVVNGEVYGDVTLTADRTIDDLTIPAGTSLTVSKGKTLTVNGTVTNSGTLSVFDDSSLAGTGSLTGSGSFVMETPEITVASDLEETGAVLDPAAALSDPGFSFGGVTFTADTTGWTGPVYDPAEVKNEGEYTVSFTKGDLTVSKTFTVGPKGPKSYYFDISKGEIKVVDGDTTDKVKVEYGGGLTTPEFDPSTQVITVTGTVIKQWGLYIDTATPLTIKASNLTIDNYFLDNTSAMNLRDGAADVTLVLEGENFLAGGRDNAGIAVEEGRKLTITGTGSLKALAGDHFGWVTSAGAGIGGNVNKSCGTVIIESGTITAIGGADAAGIGGGGKYGDGNTTGRGGAVKINGGTVTAIGNANINTVFGSAYAGNWEGDDSVDIGGGTDNPNTGKLTVNGDAWVTAPNIGAIPTLTRGVVNGKVYRRVTLTEDRTVDDLTIPPSASLTIPKDVTLTVNGTVNNSGTLSVFDVNSLAGEGSLAGDGSFLANTPKITVASDLVETGEVLDPAALSGFVFSFGGKDFTSDATGWTGPVYDPAPVKDAGEYTVSFTKDGATVSKTFTVNCEIAFIDGESGFGDTVPYGTGYGEVIEPEREGYTFDGWFTAGGEEYDPTAHVIHSATYYARYTPNEYEVTYGDETMDVTYGEPFTVPEATGIGENQTFYAWFGNDGNIYLPGATYTYTLTGDLELNPLVDTDTTYWTVNFIGEDGYLYRTELVEQTSRTKVTLPEYTEYPEAIWETDDTVYNTSDAEEDFDRTYFIAGDIVVITGNTTFTVKAPVKHTVTFTANGYQVAQYTVRDGETLAEIPEVPETYGYYGKWDTDLTQPITGDLTVTASYKAVTCYIQYRLTEDQATTVTSQAVDFNKYFTPVAYTWDVPDGQSFLAWRGKDGNLYVPGLYYLMKNTNPLVVTPIFENNTEYWTVKFMGEDGYLYDVAFVEKTSDATVTLPTYAEYPDATWLLDNADGLVEYNADRVVPVTGDTTFMVKAPAKHTVTFMANGYLVAQHTVREGEALPTVPAVPGKEGYTGTWGTVAEKMGTSDLVYTASYTPRTFMVRYSFTRDGSAKTLTHYVPYGNSYEITNYTGDVPDGQNFLGWSGSDGNFYVAGRSYTWKTAASTIMKPVFEGDTEYWTVNFIGEDGYLYRTELVEQTSDATVTLPTYAPYADATWVLDGTEYNADDTVDITGDTTFTVKAPALFTVTFKAQGYLVAQYTVRDGETLPEIPAVPGKSGYSGKWDTNLNGVAITGDLTVTAAYTAVMRTIPYRMNEHDTTDLASQQVRFDGYFQPLPYTWEVPDGQSFLGWRGTDGNFYIPNTTYRMTCDYTLIMTPVFEDNTEYWTVKFIGESGYLYDVALVEKTSDAAVAMPTYAPYADATWVLDGTEYNADDTVDITGDTTFTVKAPALYTVTFMANGYQVAQYTVRDGETLPEVPAVPEKYGYTGQWDADTDAAITEDTVIEAAYTANEYTIYYHDETGAVYYEEDVTFGDWFTPVAFEGTVPDGMKFLGWNGDDGQFFLAGVPQRLSVASYLDLLPVFDSDTEYWTVKFCHPDGSLENVYLVEQAAINGTEFFIADKEYSLYPDAEWMLTSGDVDGVAVGEIVSKNYITVRSDVVFTAVVPETYTILFYSEEGYLMDVRFVMENELIGAGPVAPAKEGYTFVGWQDENGELLDDTTVATQDMTYRPVYTANVYPITLVPSEHVALGVLPESAEASVGDIITIGTAAVAGFETYYVCVYYQNEAGMVPVAISPLPGNAPYDTPDMNGYTFVMPAGPVVVQVVEQANRNTAQFIVDNDLYALEYILSGETPTAPAEPVKEGYTFIGWKASDGTVYTDDFAALYADETYNAVFEINSYDLTYYRGAEADASEFKCILALPDGTFVEFFNNDTPNMPTYVVADVTYGTTVELAEPALPGYVFKGWVDEDGYMHPAGAKYTMPARDVLLTAVWEEDTELSCLVRFVNNGELYDAYLAYDGQDASIPAVDPTADGKIFKGWKYGENTYSNTGVKDFIVVASDAREMTFEAVWEDVLYTVTYTDYETFTDIAYGTELVTLAAPEQEGYTFVAWQCVENGAYYFANTAFTVKGNMTFNAVWAKDDVQYTVKFFDENGNLYDVFVVDAGTELIAPDYEQGRNDAAYVWVDTDNNTWLYEGSFFTPTADCSYRATLVDEAEYPVFVNVESEDGEIDNVATADRSEYLKGQTVRVEISVPEGYVLKDVAAAGVGGELLPLKDSLLPMDYEGTEFLYIFEMPAAPVVVLVTLEKIPAGYTAVKFMTDGALYDYVMVERGTSGTSPETAPTKPGYEFKEWRCEALNSVVGVNAEFDVASDADDVIVYHADWNAIDYTITVDPDNGGLTATYTPLAYGEEFVLPSAPVKEGYTFVAWQDLDNGAYYTENAALSVERDMNFIAIWAENYVEHVAYFYGVDGDLYDLIIAEDGVNITAPEYLGGKTGATYNWKDTLEVPTVVVDGGQSFPLTRDYVFHANLVSEETHEVIVVVTPDELTSAVTAPTAEFTYGETVQISITVPEGYVLKSVTAVGLDGTPVVDSLLQNGSDALYVFDMRESDVGVLVEFEKIPAGYTAVKFFSDGDLYDYVMVERGTNGISPETAPSKPGYNFVVWCCDELNSYVGVNAEFPVASDAEDVIEYHAVWEAIDYMVEYRPDGGTPDPDDVHGLHYGDRITLAGAPARDGFVFIGWVEEATGFIYSAGANYVVEDNAVFTAKWEAAEYVVRFIDPDTGIIYGYEPVTEGKQVTAPAAPVASGKTFLYWENKENAADRVNADCLTPNILTDTTYYARYEVSTHNIAVITEQCSVNLNVSGAVAVGTAVQFTATANENCAMESVVLTYIDGLSPVVRELHPDASGVYTFVMPDADVTITAKAVQNVFSIFTVTDGNTSVTVLNGNKETVGETVLYIAEPTSADYVLENTFVATVSGTLIPVTRLVDGYYGFTMPAEDVAIYASSVKAEYTVTYLDDDNTLLGIVPVNSGEYATAPVAVKEGYTFDHWQILPLTDPEVDFDPLTDEVTENLVVRAVYVGDTHTVAAGLVDNVAVLRAECTISSGNVNSSDLLQTALNAETGKTVYFTVAAEYDWVVTDIAVVSAVGTDLVVEPTLREKKTEDGLVYYTYSFTMPAEDVKIDVYTVEKRFPVYVEENIGFAGEYTINGFYTNNLLCAQGSTVTIDIAPIEGYEVAEVYGEFVDKNSVLSRVDGVASADNTQFTFPMVPYEVTVYIVYAPIVYSVDVQTSNFETYKPDASQNPAAVVESLDSELTSQGKITIEGVEDIDYTNALMQVYKIPANGEAIVGQRVCFTIEEYTGYDLVSVTVTYDNGEQHCPLTFKDGKYYFDMPADDVVITAEFTEEIHTVKKDAASEAHGQVEMNGLIENSINVAYKDGVEVVVTPDAGYQVTKIYYVLADGSVKDFDMDSYENLTTMADALDTAHSIFFHMPATTVTVYVEYAPIDYTISVVKEEAEVTGQPDTANVGEQITFTTEAHYGYLITKVYVIDETSGAYVDIFTDSTNTVYGADYRFTMPASAVTIHVETIKDTYNVIYLDNGDFVAGEKIDYLDTANVSSYISAVHDADPGYHFVGWTSAETQTPVVTPSIDDSDFVIVKDTFIRAAYEKDEIDVLFTATVNGTVTEKSTGNTAEYRLDTTVFGDKVEFTAVPDVGYVIDTISITTTDSDGYTLELSYRLVDGVYSFIIPATYKASVHDIQAEDVVVTVTFKKDTFTLTKAADCETEGDISVNGSVATETSFEYLYQDEVNITATPKPGYYVASITASSADGSEKFEITGTKPAVDTLAGDALTLSFLMPACDLTYTVDYEKTDYSITCVYNPDHGKAETAPADIAQIDDIVTITVTPQPGYKLVELTVTYEGGEKSCDLTKIGENVYTFTMPTYGVTVTAIFDEITYTANLVVNGEATTALNGYDTDNYPVDYLDTCTVSVTPDAGWKLVSVVVNDGAVKVNEEIKPEGGDYTFTMPHEDVTVVVTLEKIDYTVTCVYDAEQGKAEAVETAQVGDIVTVTVTPQPGYELAQLTATYADGEKSCVLTEIMENVYTFTMPAADVTVTAVFTEVTYTANLVVVGKATTALNGYDSINIPANYLDTVTVTVTPDAGWQLVSIVINDGAVKVNEEVKPEGGNYTFTMPDEDVTIVATLEKTGYDVNAYALNFYEIGHGTVTLTPADVAYVGDNVIITADPDDGYRVKSVVVEDALGYAVPVSFISGEPGYVETWSFTMPAAAVDIYVTFEVQGASYYDDVRTDHWFYEAVTFVTDRGYFLGVAENLFGPEINMDRAMFVTVLGRISGVDTSLYTSLAFSDVEAGSYYAPYVAWAAENGIVLGRSADIFDPYADISREEMAAIMYRYCEFLGIDMTLKNQVFMDRYEDAGDISPWAEEYVKWAVGVGLIRGMTPTTIDPLSYATRAQVAQVIKNLCDKVLYR